MKKALLLMILTATLLLLMGAVPPSQPRTVMVDPTNSVVTYPTGNVFWVANSNGINAVVSGGSNTNYVSEVQSNGVAIVTGALKLNFVNPSGLASNSGGVAEITLPTGGGGTGTVTSVGLTNVYGTTISGSDITGAGAHGIAVDTNEIASRTWVNEMLAAGDIYYVSTNLDTNGFDTNAYSLIKTGPIPVPFVRSYSGVTNGQYLGSTITTNLVLILQAPVSVQSYLTRDGGATLEIQPEIYYTYDKTNLLGDFVGSTKSITTGTNLYDWTVTFPTVTATNETGFYVVRRFKVVSQVGNPGLTLSGGTNTPSHLHILVTGSGSGTTTNYDELAIANNITYAVNTNTAGTETVFYLDMTKAMQELRITNIGLAGVTFHTTNRAAGLTTTLRIRQTATNSLTLGFNSGWTNFVGNLPPSALASNVWGILSISCWGGDETNVLAGYAVQPY